MSAEDSPRQDQETPSVPAEAPAAESGLDSMFHAVVDRLPAFARTRVVAFTGGRFGLAAQIWGGLLAMFAVVMVTAVFGLGLMTVINQRQSRVTQAEVPGLIASFRVSRSAAALVGAAPQMLVARSPDELTRREEEVAERAGLLGAAVNRVLIMDVFGADSTLAAPLDELTDNLDQIRISASLLLEHNQQLVELEADIGALLESVRILLEDVIDDQEFFVATGFRERGQPAASLAVRASPAEQRYLTNLLDLRADVTVASQLMLQGARAESLPLLLANRERAQGSFLRINTVLSEIRTGTAARFRPGVDALRALYEADDGVFAVRELWLRENAAAEQILAESNNAADQLVATTELLVSRAEQSTAEAADATAALVTLSWWLILGFGLAASGAVIWFGWHLFGKRLLSRTQHLAHSMRQMSGGDLEVKVKIQGNDEVGDMAQALEVFRQHALEVQRLNLVEKLAAEIQEKNERLEGTLEELRRTQQQVVTQEKLASLGALTAGIAHEIRNPLNFVNNFAVLSVELIEEVREELGIEAEDDGDDEGGEDGEGSAGANTGDADWEYVSEILGDLTTNVAKVREHGLRANRIVEGMLAHSREEAGHLEDVNVNQLVDEYAKLAYHGLRATDSNFNVTLDRQFDPAAGNVKATARDLSRVFLNIVTNACHATQARFEQEERGTYSPTVVLKTEGDDDWVEIRIRDNGTGIPDDVRDRIFDPFFTTKSGTQGTGLGLSISHEIVQEHGGSLAVDTEPGVFTEFTVRIPRRSAASDPAGVA